MKLQIGDKVGNKIYAGPDYGLQSPASYQKLKESGALKLGASAVRRGTQLLRQLKNRLPKPIKRAVDAYGRALAVSEQLQSQGEDKIIREGGAASTYLQLQRGAAKRDQKLIKQLSDKSNVDPLIVSGSIEAAKSIVDARVGASMGKSTLKGAVSRLDAPVARAMGPQDINSSRIKQALQRAREARARAASQSINDPRYPYKGGKQVVSVVGGKAQLRDAPKPQPRNRAATKFNESKTFTQGTKQGDVKRTIDPVEGSISSKGRGFDGKPGVSGKGVSPDGGYRPGGKGTPRISKSKLREISKQRRERNLLRNRAQERAVNKFFSGDGTEFHGQKGRTADTFPSKKGKEVRTHSAADEAFDTLDDYRGDRFQEGNVESPLDRGIQYVDGEVSNEGGGRRGAAKPLTTSLQLQAIGKKLKVKNFHLLPAKRRREILIDQLRSNGVNVSKLTPTELGKELRKLVNDLKLTDRQVRNQVRDYTSERAFPEQFNQLEAQDRGATYKGTVKRERPDGSARWETRLEGGKELPSPSKAEELKARMKAQRKRGKDTRTEREKRLGIAQKHKTGVLKPKAGEKKYPKLGNRTDNVEGGRRIKQTQATYKERIAKARARRRAKDIATVPAKTGSTRSGYASNVDRAAQARRQKSKSDLPQASDVRSNKTGTKPSKQDEQFLDAPDPDSGRAFAKGSERKEFNRIDDLRSRARGIKRLLESKRRVKAKRARTEAVQRQQPRLDAKGREIPELRGDNRRNSSIKEKIAEKRRKAELAGDVEPDINKAEPKGSPRSKQSRYRRFRGRKGADGKAVYDTKGGKKIRVDTSKATEVGSASPNRDAAGGKERKPGSAYSPTPMPRQSTSNRARLILEQEYIDAGLDPSVITQKQIRAKARELVAEARAQREGKANLQEEFNRAIAPQRNRSPQDELVNPNPFKADGELRSATIVSREGVELGVDGVKVEKLGMSPRDPAGPGRSKDSFKQKIVEGKKVVDEKGKPVMVLDLWKKQSSPDAVRQQIEFLTDIMQEVKVNGQPTKRAIKAYKMLDKMGVLSDSMKATRLRSYQRGVDALNQQRGASQRLRLDQGRVRAGALRQKLDQKLVKPGVPAPLGSRKSKIKERLQRIKQLRNQM